jgi:hypothetical protein
MIENAFYFKHDYNARNNPKIMELRARFGEDGGKAYGVFWMLIEAMAESSTTGINPNMVAGLALSFTVATDWLKRLISECLDIGLFVNDGDAITAERIMQHKAERAAVIEKRSNAGKASALKRAVRSTDDEQTVNSCSTPVQQNSTEERKGKERKGEEDKTAWVNLSLFENGNDSPVESQTKKEASKRFIKPTLEQLEAKFKERGSEYPKQDADDFFNHYETYGWAVGNKQMKSWEHAIATWMKRPYYGKNRTEKLQEKPALVWNWNKGSSNTPQPKIVFQ